MYRFTMRIAGGRIGIGGEGDANAKRGIQSDFEPDWIVEFECRV